MDRSEYCPPAAVRRTVLVTGGARGIGHSLAETFRGRGWRVLTPTRSEMDLGSVDAVIRYCAQLEEPVDVLVNNAGLNVLAELDAIQPQQWNEMVQVDLAAPLLLAQCLAPGMKRRGWGRILNISSIFSMVSKERRLAYSSVKAGLNGMTRALALELAPFHVLVNAICPGYVETDMTRANNTADDLAAIARLIPLGRLARPEEIAQVAAFLCSEENTYLTGQCLAVDGGFLLR